MLPSIRLEPQSVIKSFEISSASVRDVFVGFSGATVWQIDDGSHQFALKAYPTSYQDARHLQEIHRWVAQAGPALVPQPRESPSGVTVLASQGRLWELVDWREGTPTDDVGPVLESVARLHVSWQRPPIPHQPCPSVSRQWAVFNEWAEARPTHIDSAELIEAANLLARHINSTRDALRSWLTRPVPMQMVHGDLWKGNVLVHHGQVSGIIDCAAVRVDSIVSDLARLSGVVSSETSRQIAEKYEPIRPFQPVEWQLLKTLGRTGPIARLAQWLLWLMVEQREFQDAPAAQRRFAEILAQAQMCDG